jgi:hypothetical protein
VKNSACLEVFLNLESIFPPYLLLPASDLLIGFFLLSHDLKK